MQRLRRRPDTPSMQQQGPGAFRVWHLRYGSAVLRSGPSVLSAPCEHHISNSTPCRVASLEIESIRLSFRLRLQLSRRRLDTTLHGPHRWGCPPCCWHLSRDGRRSSSRSLGVRWVHRGAATGALRTCPGVYELVQAGMFELPRGAAARFECSRTGCECFFLNCLGRK